MTPQKRSAVFDALLVIITYAATRSLTVFAFIRCYLP
jgi:hypothetical protein